MKLYRSLFTNLITINLKLDEIPTTTNKSSLFRISDDPNRLGFADLLAVAKNLQHLKVQRDKYPVIWDDVDPDDEDVVRQGRTVSHYPNLQSLEAGKSYCQAKELIDFLTAHASSLRTVSFVGTVLTEGSWEEVARCLAGLHLTRLTLGKLFCVEGWSTAVRSYIFEKAGSEAELVAMILKGEDISPEYFSKLPKSNKEVLSD